MKHNQDQSKAMYNWGYELVRDAVKSGEDVNRLLPAVTAEVNKRGDMKPLEGALACLLACSDALCAAGRYTLTAEQAMNWFIEACLVEKERMLGRALKAQDWPQLSALTSTMVWLIEEQRQHLQWSGMQPFVTRAYGG